MTDMNPAESESLPAHVAACGVRYKNLHDYLKSLSGEIRWLRRGMFSGMVIIIGLLSKMAFWPGGG